MTVTDDFPGRLAEALNEVAQCQAELDAAEGPFVEVAIYRLKAAERRRDILLAQARNTVSEDRPILWPWQPLPQE